MNVLVVLACALAVASARPQQFSGFDARALQNSFNNLPSAAAAFETDGTIGGLDKVGDRIAEAILQATDADRQDSTKKIIALSDGFLDSVGAWVKELPDSAFVVPQVNIPQVVIPKFDVPENWKFSDIKIPEVVIPEVPTFNRN